MIWTGVVALAIVAVGRIRSRSKLIKVGAFPPWCTFDDLRSWTVERTAAGLAAVE